ncbi:hypothetical protein [Brevibacillus thermoruber]|jgi:hypothetical protein|uniref:hypothetical protein n=1 Tax=Brevibacillus thermoruber TaxID=33942 RepID=UPI0005522C40|nr:hypothetical protein [Brevibacillus thermoruber]
MTKIGDLISSQEVDRVVKELMAVEVRSITFSNGVDDFLNTLIDGEHRNKLKLYKYCLSASLEYTKNFAPNSIITGLFSVAISIIAPSFKEYPILVFLLYLTVASLIFRFFLLIRRYYNDLCKLALLKELVERALELVEKPDSKEIKP